MLKSLWRERHGSAKKEGTHTAEIRVKIYNQVYYSVHHTAWIHSTVVRTPVIAGLRTKVLMNYFALKVGQCNCTIIDYVRRVAA